MAYTYFARKTDNEFICSSKTCCPDLGDLLHASDTFPRRKVPGGPGGEKKASRNHTIQRSHALLQKLLAGCTESRRFHSSWKTLQGAAHLAPVPQRQEHARQLPARTPLLPRFPLGWGSPLCLYHHQQHPPARLPSKFLCSAPGLGGKERGGGGRFFPTMLCGDVDKWIQDGVESNDR